MIPGRSIRADLSCLVLFASVAALCAANAHPLDNWRTVYTIQSPYSSSTFMCVRATRGLRAAVGSHGLIATSENGVDWAAQTSGFTGLLYGVAHGNGTYVAVGEGGTILSSPDGTNWLSRPSGLTSRLFSIAYGNGVFVVLPEWAPANPTVLTSEDGTTWGIQHPVAPIMPYLLTFGGGLFLAEHSPGTNLLSADGTNWYAQVSGSSAGLYTAGFGGNSFMAIDTLSRVFTSKDATNWVARGKVSIIRPPEVGFGNGYYLAVGNGPPEYSTTGDSWTKAGTNAYSASVTFDNGCFLIASGNRILKSDPIISLDLQVGGSLSLQGPVGTRIKIEGTDSFDSVPTWQELTNFVLESTPQAWADPRFPSDPARFYRATLLP